MSALFLLLLLRLVVVRVVLGGVAENMMMRSAEMT